MLFMAPAHDVTPQPCCGKGIPDSRLGRSKGRGAIMCESQDCQSIQGSTKRLLYITNETVRGGGGGVKDKDACTLMAFLVLAATSSAAAGNISFMLCLIILCTLLC